MSARCVMVLGTSSGAGKSWLTTALCRHYANQGLRVAPFKAQNMSGNGRALALDDGSWGEISAAQVFQALAARATPHADMNPLLLKPDADTHSQVVLLGHADAALSASPWHDRSERVWPAVAAALARLRARYDVVVIEGAGSPAEINLMAHDIVNLRVAREANARCLLVSDIDRGGAFAHLYGTWALLPGDDRARIAGFVLNKFRGDAALLEPGPRMLQERTGVPTLAVIPMMRGHGLPEEDGWFDHGTTASSARPRRWALLAWPHVSMLDALEPLHRLPGVHPYPARTPQELGTADCILIPGSNAPASDLVWAHAERLDAALQAHVARGGTVLALGTGAALAAAHVQIAPGPATLPALGLLPLQMQMQTSASRPPTQAAIPPLAGRWQALTGCTASEEAPAAMGTTEDAQGCTRLPGALWQNPHGNVLACAWPHLLENTDVQQALFGAALQPLDAVFDTLAGTVSRCFASSALQRLID